MSQDNKSQLYNSLGGKTKTKFDFSNHKKAQSIGESNFFKWTSGNMYRTSYNDMSNKVSYTIPLPLVMRLPETPFGDESSFKFIQIKIQEK